MRKSYDNDIPAGYARVTEVLKYYNNFHQVEQELLEYKCDLGERTHYFCELHTNNLLIEEPDEDCKGYFESFKSWFEQTVSEVIFTEKRFNSDRYQLSGKIDLLVKFKDSKESVIVDIKTPKVASKTWPLQVAAYDILLNDYKDESYNCTRRGCLMLDKNGKDAKFIEYDDHKHLILFLNALEIHRFFQ